MSCVFEVHCVPKKRSILSFSISLPNIDRFSKFFHWHILWTISKNYYCYYLVACWRPTTCPCQMSLSLISVASSTASRAPVSLFRVSTYVALCLPRLLRSWLGSHSTRGCALSSGWRMQWPASCSLLAAIVLLT